ncbi:MAG: hypothetical protein ABIK12_00340 [Pseudomonadota bacterium]
MSNSQPNNGSQVIEVRAKSANGFWRCGHHFTRGWESFQADQFTPEDWERIQNEPMLEVREVPPPEPEEEATQEPNGPELAATLADGRPRCQHVFDSGSQCNRAAKEGSDKCDKHQPEQPEAEQPNEEGTTEGGGEE